MILFSPIIKSVNIYSSFSMNALRELTTKEDEEQKKKANADGPKASYGYGGSFGVQTDR